MMHSAVATQARGPGRRADLPRPLHICERASSRCCSWQQCLAAATAVMSRGCPSGARGGNSPGRAAAAAAAAASRQRQQGPQARLCITVCIIAAAVDPGTRPDLAPRCAAGGHGDEAAAWPAGGHPRHGVGKVLPAAGQGVGHVGRSGWRRRNGPALRPLPTEPHARLAYAGSGRPYIAAWRLPASPCADWQLCGLAAPGRHPDDHQAAQAQGPPGDRALRIRQHVGAGSRGSRRTSWLRCLSAHSMHGSWHPGP
jgi:hypothetical protein